LKLNNLKIASKLGVLVGVALLGLCTAGVLAGHLMQQEMMDARIDQVRAIVELARNMAIGLQKQVEAGQLTKEAALAEFGRRASPFCRPIRNRSGPIAWMWSSMAASSRANCSTA
jgi:methyl-accepting chemotaxis protein